MKLRVSWADRGHFLLGPRQPPGAGGVSAELWGQLPAGADWWQPATGLPELINNPDDHSVVFSVSDEGPHRLEFSVDTVVAGRRCRSIEVVQLLRVRADGTVAYDQHAVTRYDVKMIPTAASGVPGQRPQVRPSTTKVFTGRHPLLTVDSTGQPRVRADFLDITQLWWDLHYREWDQRGDWQFCPWYLDPKCAGNPTGLRVLASTWGVPLLWFAVAPPTTSAPLPADVQVGAAVFFRPVASAYEYSSTDAGGISNPQHARKGMEHLAHYLLRGSNRKQAKDMTYYGGHLQDLRDYASGEHDKEFPAPSSRLASLPIGLEFQLNRAAARLKETAKQQRVLLLPWPAAPGVPGAYGNAMAPDLATHTNQALSLLWARGAIGGVDQPLADGPTSFPLTGSGPAVRLDPLLWVGGYSRGGEAANRCVAANPASVSRLISVDDPTLAKMAGDLVNAVRTAKKAGRPFQAWLVRSSNTGGVPQEAVSTLRNNGAQVTVLPRGNAFWAPPPFTSPSWRQYVLADWDKEPDVVRKDVAAHGQRYSDWQHEFAAYGGETFAVEPQNPNTRGFLDECLGP